MPDGGSRILDVVLDERLAHGAEALVRVGGAEVAGTASWLGGRFFQLRLTEDVRAARGDRLEVRAGGVTTGGEVLDPDARRHGTTNDHLVRLSRLAQGLDERPGTDEALAGRLDAQLRADGLDAPPDAQLEPDERAALLFLREAGRVVRLAGGRHLHASTITRAEAVVLELGGDGRVLEPDAVAAALGTDTALAGALLELLEAERVLEAHPDGGGRRVRRR